jgi:hypothetical protein
MNDSANHRPEQHLSTKDKRFLGLLESWLESKPEILVLIRYSRAAGNKDFQFFSSFAVLSDRLSHLSPSTGVTAFGQRRLPVRGIVDEAFIVECLNKIPDRTEFLVLDIEPRTTSGEPCPHHVAGESQMDLREALEELRGRRVAVGPYPIFWDESPDVVSGIVPDENGAVTPGVY